MTLAPMRDAEVGSTDEPVALTDGIHLVVDALKLNDVHTIYGVVGIPITDLARLAQASGLRYIGFRHESDAGARGGRGRLPHAEAGHLPDRVGARLPQRPRRTRQRHHQLLPDGPDLRIQRASPRRPPARRLRGDGPARRRRLFAKAAYRVSRAEDIGRGIARAMRTAASGRPGGVYLDIPAAVLGEVLDAQEAAQDAVEGRRPAPKQLPELEAVDAAIELLAGAERPLIVLGKGAAYAQADEQIREFVESHGHPVRADVDGQGPAARRPPAVRGHRPLAGAEAGRRRDAGRRAAQLAAGTSAMRRSGTPTPSSSRSTSRPRRWTATSPSRRRWSATSAR